jgi:hypothetical protein
MCSINQNARLRKKIYTGYKNYLGSSYSVIDFCTLKTMLCVSSNQIHERIQRRASKFILDLPFICDVSYSKRLELLDLIPLCYWHEFLDLVFYFGCVNGIININGNILPSIQIRQRATRSADPDCLKFTTPKCRTATFQRSFISRCARVWNVLPKELRTKNISLGRFQSDLYEYYKSALIIYDA